MRGDLLYDFIVNMSLASNLMILHILLIGMVVFTTVFSVADFMTNKFYQRIWPKTTPQTKRSLIYYLVLHNAIYFLVYISIFVLCICYRFAHVGWYILYLCGLITLQLHWWTNNDKCGITQKQNKLLRIHENYAFRDPYSIVFSKYYRDNPNRSRIYHIYTITCIVIVCACIGCKLYGL